MYGSVRRLFVRRFDQDEAAPLPGTELADHHFFSADGTAVGFLAADRALKTVSLADGLVAVVARGVDRFRGAAWGEGGIVFVRDGGLWQIAPSGGQAASLTTPNREAGELFHGWPAVVDGGGLLFTTVMGSGANRIEAIRAGSRHVVVESGSYPLYSTSGHIVFFRDGALVVAAFDSSRMQVTGPAVRLSETVATDSVGAPLAALSPAGSLVYTSSRMARNRLVWVSRQGLEEPVTASPDLYAIPRLAPDGRRLVVNVPGDVRVLDLVRGTATRLTSDSSLGKSYASWSRDGARVVYRTATGLAQANADGSGGVEAIAGTSNADFPNSVSPDNGALAITRQTEDASGDVYALSLGAKSDPKPVVSTPAFEGGAQFSPDGRWIAYVSNESGRFEVYLRPYPGPDRRIPVSTQGGTQPVWNPSGKELFYRDGSRMFVVDVSTTPELTLSKPRLLFDQNYGFGAGLTIATYDVSPDGQRFVMIKGDSTFGRLSVVLNWAEELKRLAPVR
jgi:serine/threonine-protein kinase